jgi:hypothetical protein
MIQIPLGKVPGDVVSVLFWPVHCTCGTNSVHTVLGVGGLGALIAQLWPCLALGFVVLRLSLVQTTRFACAPYADAEKARGEIG